MRTLGFKGLLWVLAVSISGCTTVANKPGSASFPSYKDASEPLVTSLDEKAEYELMLDLAVMEIKQQRYDRAEGLLQKLRKINHQDIEVYRMLAKVYEGQEKRHLALLAWRQIIQMPNHSIEDESEYARMALAEDQFALAEAIYQQWLQSDSLVRRVSALNNLGFSRLLQKDFASAKSYFNQALQLDPLNSKALNNLILVDALTEK